MHLLASVSRMRMGSRRKRTWATDKGLQELLPQERKAGVGSCSRCASVAGGVEDVSLSYSGVWRRRPTILALVAASEECIRELFKQYLLPKVWDDHCGSSDFDELRPTYSVAR
ncbi:unnamed protein product [Peniophora sp. CBMAI 1063]|nr:unnamed protein product [Peniophora sp. CBMAI 1063]